MHNLGWQQMKLGTAAGAAPALQAEESKQILKPSCTPGLFNDFPICHQFPQQGLETAIAQFHLLLHPSEFSRVLLEALLFSASNQSTCLKTISLQHQQSSYIIYTSIVQLSLKNARVQNRLFYFIFFKNHMLDFNYINILK